MQNFQLYTFAQLTTDKLYRILALRAEIFVVEQASPYLDLDGLDQQALHLCLQENETLVGYTRLLPPKTKFAEASVGRIIVAPSQRNKGLGRILIERSLEEIQLHYGNTAIRIEAQHHLLDFYRSFGFTPDSELYDWGGIPHVKMVANPK